MRLRLPAFAFLVPLSLWALCPVSVSPAAWGQDDPTPTAESGQPGDAADPQEPSSDFDVVFAQWKELLKQLRDLQERFRIAGDDELAGIRAEYQATLERGRALIPQLRDAALKSYSAAAECRS